MLSPLMVPTSAVHALLEAFKLTEYKIAYFAERPGRTAIVRSDRRSAVIGNVPVNGVQSVPSGSCMSHAQLDGGSARRNLRAPEAVW